MDCSTVTMMNLPDEMILAICSQMDTIDVLYSFIGVNERLSRLTRDVIFTQSIQLIKRNDEGTTRSLSDLVLDRFCRQILPEIHTLVESLTVESSAVERSLSVGHYPRLRNLTLVDIDEHFAVRHFTENSPFAPLFQKQISSLNVTIVDPGRSGSIVDIAQNIFTPIFSLCTSLIELDCSRRGSNWFRVRFPSADPSSTIFSSSSIVRLRVDVETLDDCLYLLDGRLPHLQRLIIEIELINPSDIVADTKILVNLKSLSFLSFRRVKVYDTHLLPLLCQMTGLEELSLRLYVTDRSTFIESTHLNRQILSYLPHLRTFNCDIFTHNPSMGGAFEQPIKEIQYLFYNNQSHELLCYIHRQRRRSARSHIFSLPFVFDTMKSITSHFPGGFFPSVRRLVLHDSHFPLEHDFFVRIDASFPLLTSLWIMGDRPQEKKRVQQSNGTEPIAPAVEFNHLTDLGLIGGHVDYAEQFLVDTNTRLPRLTKLTMDYEQLSIVTENFSRDATRRNCINIEHLQLDKTIVHSKEMCWYFPSCK